MAPTNAPSSRHPIRVLWLLFALYALPGLIDHDPWRGDDAEFFSVIADLLGGGDWLSPSVAGHPLPDYPPLYYWLGGVLGKALGWLMPLHDAARLASLLCVGATLYFLARAARLFLGEKADRPAVLLGLGTLGLLTHAHEFQPQLALLACSAASFLGFAEFRANPRRGALIAAPRPRAFRRSGLRHSLQSPGKSTHSGSRKGSAARPAARKAAPIARPAMIAPRRGAARNSA